jgi:nitroreductase/ferredoxin
MALYVIVENADSISGELLMGLFHVDEDRCARDGICAAECPLRLIVFKGGDSVPVPAKGAEEMCINCGHCVAVCPNSALSLATMKPADCPPVRVDLLPGPADVEHFLRARRSIRTYRRKKVEKGRIEKVINVSSYAPTGSNTQQVGWLVINGREEVRALASMVVDWMRHVIKQKGPAAKALRMAGIVRAWKNGVDIVCRGAPALVVAHAPENYPGSHTDCTIALTYFTLAAPSFGLGTCWAGYFMIAAAEWPPLRQALGLPEGRAEFGAMMVGYPKYEYKCLPLRNRPDITWRSG